MRLLGVVPRFLVLPLALGFATVLVTAAVYWGLEVLLAGFTDYSRGLWEGCVTAFVINAGHTCARFVLRRMDAEKKKVALS